MHQDLTDEQIKTIMRETARLSGLALNDRRIEADLRHFKRHLEAIDAVGRVKLSREDEPMPTFRLHTASRKA